ncbi:Ferrous-iron efflux pump FieF [subsurface metagenome]
MDDKIKFGLLTLLVILFQSVLKLYGVIITGSLSFLSETVDTFVDIVFVSITLYSLSKSQKPPDIDHMFGHSKIDPIGALVQGIVLINLYILLIINAILIINTGTYSLANPVIGLQLLLISFSVNFIFSRYLILQGRRRKSLSLEIQGLNLFQDSLRAILIMISFLFALFGIIYLDPFFSIALSIFIIIGAIRLVKKGINDLTDTNPISILIIEEIRQNIFNLEHVNEIEDLKIRASGPNLFLEAHLSVEDHISVIHAHDITKSIRNKDLNILRIEDKYFLSMIIVVKENLTLKDAHEVSTKFEKNLKDQAKNMSRIITHIEGAYYIDRLSPKQFSCTPLNSDEMKSLTNKIEIILKGHSQVRGYHGLECWTSLDYCVIEVHVFFDGSLNISQVHEYTSDLEKKIKDLNVKNLQEVILHSEPSEGRTDGILF